MEAALIAEAVKVWGVPGGVLVLVLVMSYRQLSSGSSSRDAAKDLQSIAANISALLAHITALLDHVDDVRGDIAPIKNDMASLRRDIAVMMDRISR